MGTAKGTVSSEGCERERTDAGTVVQFRAGVREF